MNPNIKIIRNFLSPREICELVEYIDCLGLESQVENIHISAVANELKGKSLMFDLSKTDVSKYLSNFQSSNNVHECNLPNIFFDILDRISTSLQISKENVFLQIIDQSKGGKIIPHYDTGYPGFINYKCNISPLCEEYSVYVGDDIIKVSNGDLYSFEASLYKHWTGEFTHRRILLSYGFAIKYGELGRDNLDPRVRMSERIQKYFQK